MSQDDIIRFARATGIAEWEIGAMLAELEQFADLVAAAERKRIGTALSAQKWLPWATTKQLLAVIDGTLK